MPFPKTKLETDEMPDREPGSGVFFTETAPSSYAFHDAKNLLASVTLNLAYVRSELPGRDLPRDLNDAILDMAASVEELESLIHRALLSASSPHAPTSVDVQRLLTDATHQVRSKARARQVAIEIAFRGVTTRAYFDKAMVTRALHNLLDNAIRYSPPGGVVRLEAEIGRHDLHFSVSDQGPGVDPELGAKIFEPFVSSGNPSDANVGLGLAFCREVAHSHGGDLHVETAESGGARFVLTIPL